MKNNGLLKRVLLMIGISALVLSVFLLGVFLFYRQRTLDVTDMINEWEECDRVLYTFTERGLDEDRIAEKCDELCAYYTDELADENYQRLYDRVAEINADARTVSRFERIVTDIRMDYRYGEIRAYMDCVVDYDGYGGYLTEGEEENIVKRQKCTYTLIIEKSDDGYLISDINIKWEEK